MSNYMRTALGRFRLVGLLEGLSYVILMGVGLPLKYGFGNPIVVKIAGPIHGALTIVFVIALVHALAKKELSPWRAWQAFVLSLVPLGAFVMERLFVADERDALSAD